MNIGDVGNALEDAVAALLRIADALELIAAALGQK